MRGRQRHKLVCRQSLDLRRLESRDFASRERSYRRRPKASNLRERTNIVRTNRNRVGRPDRGNLKRPQHTKLRRRQRYKLGSCESSNLSRIQGRHFTGRECRHRGHSKASNI